MQRRPFLAVIAVVLAGCSAGDAPAAHPAKTETATSSPSRTPLPPPPLSWGPTRSQYDRAAELVGAMSVEEQAGQVIIAEYRSVEAAAAWLSDMHIGGVIVMGENVESAGQIRSDVAAMQAANDRPYPLVVGIDQEGGRVARLGEPLTEFPTLMTLGAAADGALARRAARASGEELRALGFTMVFAPVADVTSGPDDPTIGSRSASSDPAIVAEVVSGAVRGYADAGIIAVAKHFPGHGSVPADSHLELPVQTATLAELRRRDLVPFGAAVDARIPAVMVAHIDVQSVDAGVPSSLSGKVLDLLRDELGFAGLVVTDAQNMAAVAGSYGAGDAAVRALMAGVDVVLMPADVRAAHAAIVAAVSDGRLRAARLAEAATRVVALMVRQLDEPAAPPPAVVGTHELQSYLVSRAGLTVVSGPCSGALVGDSIQIVGATEADRRRVADAASAKGLTIGAGDVVRLLGGSRPGSGDVVVALDTPYALAGSSATTSRIALYGRTPAAFRALVDVLVGSGTSDGTLPVDVRGVERRGC
ncbi:MAG TPA: glycoside hydrolase family 3 N-terminal domain-containing protein [Jiangellaceae bacterium]|nr:glycoside hydrolase family 3 N-terminal domain-containing protein [Jiangellaceae bacterium]